MIIDLQTDVLAPNKPIVVHLMTQHGQSYGSERRCCERCGVMCGQVDSPKWVDEEAAWRKLPSGYARCDGS